MSHKWHFFRAGGVDQVSLRNGADLLALPELDQKLWVALAIPSTGIDVDPRTLELLDHDKDGRVRVPDIIDTVTFVGATWKSADDVLEGGDSLALSAIKDVAVLAAAKRILADLGKKDATSISLGEVTGVIEAFAGTRFNGDGVIIPETAEDADVKQAIEEIIAGTGSVTDRSGKPGIDQVKTDAFFADIDKLAAWIADGAQHLVLGEGTAAAADALAAVKPKIDDYFARTQLVAFDARAAAALNGQEAELVALGGKLLTSASEDVARLPLARIEAGKALPLDGAVNPAWAKALETFRDATVKPVLGKKPATLSIEDYEKIITKLAGYAAWHAARPHTTCDKLDEARIKALASGTQRAEIGKLIASDKALENEYGAIASVEKTLRIQRDFGRVVRNFVNFSDFYSKRDGAFQSGTLYLDGRAFRLAVPVADAGKHGALAAMSSSYLAYCDITRAGVKKAIAVAVTNGDADNIFVGRNGVFYDRAGDDWDATVTKIVSNPISIREAFWAPYKKLVRLVEEQVNKRAAEADAKANAKIETTATRVTTVDKAVVAAAAPPPPPSDPAPAPRKGLDIGIIAVISLAIGAVLGAFSGLVAMLVGMGLWMPVGVGALLLAISGPSMILAWMKLRQRNLGPILDANGWAVNTQAKVNVSFGAALTDLAALPKGATRSLDDPFADKGRPWKVYIFLIFLVVMSASWYAGKFDRYLPKQVKSGEVLGEHAPINNP